MNLLYVCVLFLSTVCAGAFLRQLHWLLLSLCSVHYCTMSVCTKLLVSLDN